MHHIGMTENFNNFNSDGQPGIVSGPPVAHTKRHEDAAKFCAPIALFVYNRPDHTRQTITALQANAFARESDLFIYSDAPKDEVANAQVHSVRRYIKNIDGFRSVTVIERERNWGVDPSIIDGVTTLCDRYGRVIVLEDDLVTSPWFLTYMNRGLALYEGDERVMQISGFMFPLRAFQENTACFLPYSTCWGWATWKASWTRFDPSASGFNILKSDSKKRAAFNLNGAYDYFDLLRQYFDKKNDAWDIRWYLSVFLNNGLSLFPQKSLVRNIGFDGSGVHCPLSDFPGDEVATQPIEHFPMVEHNNEVWKEVHHYLNGQKEPLYRKFRHSMSRVIRRLGLSAEKSVTI